MIGEKMFVQMETRNYEIFFASRFNLAGRAPIDRTSESTCQSASLADPVLSPSLTTIYGAPNAAWPSFCYAEDNYRLLSACVREEHGREMNSSQLARGLGRSEIFTECIRS